MNIKNKILLIECCNFIDFPAGGQLSFAKNLMNVFGQELALVGVTTDDSAVGVWTKKEFNGIEFDFLSLAKITNTNKKPILPYRLTSYFRIKKFNKQILEYKNCDLFIQAPEILLAVQSWKFLSISFRFAGVNNPLSISRYWYARFFGKIFEMVFYRAFKNVDSLFASSNIDEISYVEKEIRKLYPEKRIIQLFTRVDTSVFYSKDRNELREKYHFEIEQKIIIYTGRLSSIKGWKFLIESFLEFRINEPNSIFLLIGDGEDKSIIQSYIMEKNAREYIRLLGQLNSLQISEYLSLSDLFVMASFKEGWSTSLVEAMSCQVPACVTNFSSANEIVSNGVNGYVLENRDSKKFAEYMHKALLLKNNNFDASRYSIFTLKNDILKQMYNQNNARDIKA